MTDRELADRIEDIVRSHKQGKGGSFAPFDIADHRLHSALEDLARDLRRSRRRPGYESFPQLPRPRM